MAPTPKAQHGYHSRYRQCKKDVMSYKNSRSDMLNICSLNEPMDSWVFGDKIVRVLLLSQVRSNFQDWHALKSFNQSYCLIAPLVISVNFAMLGRWRQLVCVPMRACMPLPLTYWVNCQYHSPLQGLQLNLNSSAFMKPETAHVTYRRRGSREGGFG